MWFRNDSLCLFTMVLIVRHKHSWQWVVFSFCLVGDVITQKLSIPDNGWLLSPTWRLSNHGLSDLLWHREYRIHIYRLASSGVYRISSSGVYILTFSAISTIHICCELSPSCQSWFWWLSYVSTIFSSYISFSSFVLSTLLMIPLEKIMSWITIKSVRKYFFVFVLLESYLNQENNKSFVMITIMPSMKLPYSQISRGQTLRSWQLIWRVSYMLSMRRLKRKGGKARHINCCRWYGRGCLNMPSLSGRETCLQDMVYQISYKGHSNQHFWYRGRADIACYI